MIAAVQSPDTANYIYLASFGFCGWETTIHVHLILHAVGFSHQLTDSRSPSPRKYKLTGRSGHGVCNGDTVWSRMSPVTASTVDQQGAALLLLCKNRERFGYLLEV